MSVNTNPNIIASKEHFLQDAFSPWTVDHMSTTGRHHHHHRYAGLLVRTAGRPWHAGAPWQPGSYKQGIRLRLGMPEDKHRINPFTWSMLKTYENKAE